MRDTDVFIIGAGAAGLACAKSAYDAGAKNVLIADTADKVGGILPQCLHKGFGALAFGKELTGPEFLAELLKTVPDSAEILLETTVLKINPDKTAMISSENGIETVKFRSLIMACGCREKTIWSTPVTGTRPTGVYTAGLVQQLVNLQGADIGDDALIVGSGDVGLVMAGRLCELGKKPLAIIEKEMRLGGLARNIRRFVEKNEIPVLTNTRISEIHGRDMLEGVTLENLIMHEKKFFACKTLITAIGMIPEQSLLNGLRGEKGLPNWVQLCGNCDHIHELVDKVLNDAGKIGRQAAHTF